MFGIKKLGRKVKGGSAHPHYGEFGEVVLSTAGVLHTKSGLPMIDLTVRCEELVSIWKEGGGMESWECCIDRFFFHLTFRFNLIIFVLSSLR